MEFPIVDQGLIGRKTKYTYMAVFTKEIPTTQAGKDSAFFEGFVKYDLEKEQVVGRINFGETKVAGEVFFHKRDNAQSEDDGYCMSFVYDYETDKSEFVMWDAKTMDSTPVLRTSCKARVPHGFHTYFVHENDLEN